MKRPIGLMVLLALAAFTVVDRASSAQQNEQAALAKALTGVNVSLKQGLRASEAQGTPISAKFEVQDGKLQLSVYTMKGDKFSEVIVDHTTGKIAKTEAITSGKDFDAAKSQSAAMAKAKRSLREATGRAIQGNAGSRAASVTPVLVTPALKGDRPVAKITLLQGQTFKTVSEPLQ